MLNKNIFSPKNSLPVVCIAILLCLGFWQLSRLQTKTALISTLKERLEAPATNIHPDYYRNNESAIYRKVKLEGNFVGEKNIYLYGRRLVSTASNKAVDGYYLLSPFMNNDGNVILVERGWLSRSNKDKVSSVTKLKDQSLIGIIMKFEEKRMFIPENDPIKNIWFTLNYKEIQTYLGLPIAPFYVSLTSTKNEHNKDILSPLKPNPLSHIPNNHLEYAITWFSLAIALFIIILVYNRR